MFEKIYLQDKENISKDYFDMLYTQHQELLKKHNKLNRKFNIITRHSDRELSSQKAKIDRNKRLSNRLNAIVRHSDRQAAEVLREKSNLELELEYELQKVNELLVEIEETQKEVIYTMGSVVENRSKETGKHVERVAEYSKLLALAYGLSTQEAELLKQASPMHDLGKVAIADSILNKPDKLTDEEFTKIKEHAKIGYDMLKHSKRPLLQAAAVVAYEHHEKWNGEGYPQGLKGEDIHIYGRITALADVFDALTAERIYKKAWSDEEIFHYFKEQSAEQFDPKLVSIFFQNSDKFLAIRETFKD